MNGISAPRGMVQGETQTGYAPGHMPGFGDGFETRFAQRLTHFDAHEAPVHDDFVDCRNGLDKKLDGTPGTK